MANRPHDRSRALERDLAAERKAADQADAERVRRQRRQPPDQAALPFDDDDAAAIDGHLAVQVAKQRLAEQRAMASRCSCTHSRAQHITQRLVCGVAGCACSHYRR